jgi:hypothetical protein
MNESPGKLEVCPSIFLEEVVFPHSAKITVVELGNIFVFKMENH